VPTGITQPIYEGKDITFAEFVWRCARQFGALMHMRDDALDAPIRKRSDFGSYHKDELKKATARLAQLRKMSAKMADAEAEREYTEAAKSVNDAIAESYARRERYLAMLGQIDVWDPPTEEHAELKRYMVKQLSESMEHDCHTEAEFRRWHHAAQGQKSGGEWLLEQIEKAQKDIIYHSEKLTEDEARDDQRQAWIDTLNKSVPIPRSLRPAKKRGGK
jgi:hypothetical protein